MVTHSDSFFLCAYELAANSIKIKIGLLCVRRHVTDGAGISSDRCQNVFYLIPYFLLLLLCPSVRPSVAFSHSLTRTLADSSIKTKWNTTGKKEIWNNTIFLCEKRTTGIVVVGAEAFFYIHLSNDCALATYTAQSEQLSNSITYFIWFSFFFLLCRCFMCHAMAGRFHLHTLSKVLGKK